MKMYANENLFNPIIDYLRYLGHDLLSLREAGHSGASDDEVYQVACEEKRVIITMDRDFSRMFRFSPKLCGGIIVVKIYRRTVTDTLNISKKLFKEIKEEDIRENLVVITPEGVRIRRPKE